MKQRFEKLADRVGSMTNWKLGLSVQVILLVSNAAMGLLVFKLSGQSVNRGSESIITLGWFMITIFAPIMETLLFQYLLLHFFLRYFPGLMAVTGSALIFGISHDYNPMYMVVSGVVGWVLAFVFYAKWQKKKEPFTAIILVSVIHIIHNSIIFFGRDF